MTNQPQQQQTPQPVIQQQVITETTVPKVTSKISQLSNLEEQLSKIHQKPFTQPPAQQLQQAPAQAPSSYSEAVRQSPTTVQQQFPQTTITQQQSAQLQPPPVALTSFPSPVVSSPASAQKVSRFQVSKVEEQKQTLLSQASPLKPLLSPEIEVTNVNLQHQMTQQVFTPPQVQALPQSSQAQAFFQQHQGGVVSKKFLLFPLLFCVACLWSFF